MSKAQSSSDQIGPGGPSSRPFWVSIARYIVPIPKGKGAWGKAAWVGRRIVLWYVIILVMLATFQRRLIYQPTQADTISPEFGGLLNIPFENVTVDATDGLPLHGWFVRATPQNSKGRPGVSGAGDGNSSHPVVIYFPGNAGHRGYRVLELDVISRLGADVYLFDYRGYGDNAGSPSEELLAADARSVWQTVTGKRGAKPSQVVLLGESLGGGVATRLASDVCAAGTPPGGVVLRSTFSSLVDVAAHHYWWLPVRTLLIDRFPSAERIRSVTCPVLVIHGTADTIVPFACGERLFEAAPETSTESVAKTFAELPGAGHNDILYVARDAYRKSLRDFLDHIRTQP
jgi:fermentation-respiration switch protein FrsA (DUF1100 family)